MTTYQIEKTNFLNSLGWTANGKHYLGGNHVYKMESQSGIRAYVYPNWVQFIN